VPCFSRGQNATNDTRPDEERLLADSETFTVKEIASSAQVRMGDAKTHGKQMISIIREFSMDSPDFSRLFVIPTYSSLLLNPSNRRDRLNDAPSIWSSKSQLLRISYRRQDDHFPQNPVAPVKNAKLRSAGPHAFAAAARFTEIGTVDGDDRTSLENSIFPAE
jgi:hypothetical protein